MLLVEPRDERWLVRLPGDRVAWFATTDAGVRRVATERRVLAVLAARCTFGVPRVLHDGGDFDVRAMVPGLTDPWRLFAPTPATGDGRGEGLAARTRVSQHFD